MTSVEISLSDQEFKEIRQVIKDLTGISMSETKRQLIYRRVSSRLKAANVESFSEYMDLLRQGDAIEIEEFSNAVTTNLTSFFREKHHFEYLAKTILPEVNAASADTKRRLRIWSAGCSTGEEPYSIAITLQEAMPQLALWDAKILCTDLDTAVLSTSKEGVYACQRVEKLEPRLLQRWFKKSRVKGDERVRVSPALQKLTVFRQLNLMYEWPMRGPFDVIFCRNVIIYFDKPTQRILIDRYADLLKDGGYLILGHSESLFNVSDRFSLIGHTMYQKND